jgi:hypothetical protein
MAHTSSSSAATPSASPAAETLPATPAADEAIARMRARVRLVRALRASLQGAMVGAAFAVVALALAKVGRVSDRAGRWMLLGALGFPLVGGLWAALRRVSRLWAAQMLDQAYALKDRLSNAVEFAELPPGERTRFMDAAIEDAETRAREKLLDPKKALAFTWPAEAGYAAALLVVLGVVASIELRTRVYLPAPIAQGPRDPLELAEDDVDAFRDFARQVEERADTPEARQAAERFRQFVDQIANRRLDREEAFRRLQQLQQEMEAGRESERESLREALRQLGRDMQNEQNDPRTRELANALQNADAQRAAEQLRELARQARENRMTQQQRQSLQNALRAAQERREREQQQLQQQLQQLRQEIDRMLRQQRERSLAQNEQRMLRQRQRELERLERQQQQQQQRRRQLERLERAMSRAMQNLMRDLQQAAQNMEEGAQDLHRMQQQQLTEQQIAELRQQLEELRQRMRQQNGQGGQQQRQRLQRFAERARGGVQPGGMQPGGGQQPGGRLGLLRLQRGSAGGSQSGQGQGQSQGQGQNGGQGQDPGGQGYGTEHDEQHRGAATAAIGRTQQVNVSGQSGQGPSRSQVIRTAAQEGFTTAAYRQVHREYWDHAREVIHAGEVPPGYRSYVRRYFQLIRPRDEQ